MLKHLILAVTLAAPLPAFAQETGHEGHMMGDKGPASMAFMEANDRMHQAMMMEYTGNADVDFVKGMIAHHEGAIAMANDVLTNGKNSEILALANAVVSGQSTEIETLKPLAG